MHGVRKHTTMFSASLDGKIAFDLAELELTVGVLEETVVHGEGIAALLEEMKDLKELASFES